ncbi:MAG: hypothetical protein H9536_00050 [Aphanizomenon flos-aquae Clear-A1]|jgi:hypothetical protein|nr:hypothetical protein [Aphanizomenon flos-aquae Clear-A1]
MSEIPLCSILISSQLPPDEIESLETSLSLSSIKVQKSPNRVLGVDDIVLLITVASATAQLIDYSIKAAKSINNWRQKLREKGIEAKGKLKHPQLPDIDLSTATEAEIEAWFKRLETCLSHK